MKMKVLSIIVSIFLFCILAFSVTAAPNGVEDFDRSASERGADITASSQKAEAGNITAYTINGTQITQRWQGFYGNVSGRIVLDDSGGNTLYDWTLVDPTGEIYAANHSSVTWANIDCVNLTPAGSPVNELYDEQSLNRYIGYTTVDERNKKDSVNSTFNLTLTSTLTVGAVSFTGVDNCSMVALHDSAGYDESNFQEVLMTDNVSIVFTAILEDDVSGFDSTTADFEMIVGVNGTVEGTTRDYYFYVELS